MVGKPRKIQSQKEKGQIICAIICGKNINKRQVIVCLKYRTWNNLGNSSDGDSNVKVLN